MASKPKHSKALPAAPPWMNPAAKRLFSVILAQETEWKGHILRSEVEQIADLICHRQRIDVLRKMMRATVREKDVTKVLAVSREISSTVAAAHRLASELELKHHEEAVESDRRGR